MTTTDAVTEAGASRRSGRRTWLWSLLIVSLAVNLLFVGTIVGVGMGRRMDRFGGGHGGDPTLSMFVQGLSPERQKAARQIIRSRQGMMGPLRADVRRARMAAGRAFLADPFDAAAFRAAQERLIESETAQRRAQIEIQSTIAAGLTAAERREYLSWRNGMRAKRGMPVDPSLDDPDLPPTVPLQKGG